MDRKRNLYRDVVLGLSEGIYVFDSDGRFQLMNPAAERILGWTAEDLANLRIGDIFHGMNPEANVPGEGFDEVSILQNSGSARLAKDVLCLLKDGTAGILAVQFSAIRENGRAAGWIAAFQPPDRDDTAACEYGALATQLRDTLAVMNSLNGILPICSACKKIRERSGQWADIEEYISSRTSAEFSHSICPECAMKLYPNYFKKEECPPLLPRDKRTLERHVFASPIDYVVSGNDPAAVHRGFMTDISTLGFGGYLWTDVCVGQEIIIKSKLPVAFQKAVICWIQKDNDNFFRTGLKFAEPASLSS